MSIFQLAACAVATTASNSSTANNRAFIVEGF